MKKQLDVVGLTQAIVAMNTINPPGNELKCAAFLADILESSDFDTQLVKFADGRANLIARKGHVDGVKPICLTGHIDTVPLGHEPWTQDPFNGEIIDGKLYGRGSCDMKGGVAAIIVAAINIGKNLLNTGGVTLIFTCGEETGCEGAKALCKMPEVLGEASAIIVGEPTSNKPLIGHKGALWLHAACKGVTAHGSTPELGVNAIYKASRSISQIENFGFDVPPHEVMGNPSINVGRMR
ncbi:MAG: succinyl-diaminopimelate desuccinylase, partial [Candidatus Azotimanducaceae bacterium]